MGQGTARTKNEISGLHHTRIERIEEALQEQGESHRLHIFTGGIVAILAEHVLFKFIAA